MEILGEATASFASLWLRACRPIRSCACVKQGLTEGPYCISLNNEIPHKLLCDVSQKGGWGSKENVTMTLSRKKSIYESSLKDVRDRKILQTDFLRFSILLKLYLIENR